MSDKAKKEFLSWVKTIVLAVVIALFVDYVVIVNATVPTGSMKNTIMEGDRVIALRFSYLFDDPQRGDVVIFEYPDAPEGEKILYVKRIIGLPGETVEVKDGGVYINGSDTPLEEDYIREKPIGEFGPYEVPEDSYFMMGDNRNDSQDSRYWVDKYVEKDEILGKVVFKYYKKPGLIK